MTTTPALCRTRNMIWPAVACARQVGSNGRRCTPDFTATATWRSTGEAAIAGSRTTSWPSQASGTAAWWPRTRDQRGIGTHFCAAAPSSSSPMASSTRPR